MPNIKILSFEPIRELKPPQTVLVVPVIRQREHRPIQLTNKEDRNLPSLVSVIMRQPKVKSCYS